MLNHSLSVTFSSARQRLGPLGIERRVGELGVDLQGVESSRDVARRCLCHLPHHQPYVFVGSRRRVGESKGDKEGTWLIRRRARAVAWREASGRATAVEAW